MENKTNREKKFVIMLNRSDIDNLVHFILPQFVNTHDYYGNKYNSEIKTVNKVIEGLSKLLNEK